MEVTLKAHTRRVKKKNDQDFSWYDPNTKKMCHGRGGQLTFEYNTYTKKRTPKIIDQDINVNENSWNDILSWVKQKNYDLTVQEIVPGVEVVLDCDDYDWYKAEKELRDLGIIYEVT